MAKLLVTGATGMLGCTLVPKLQTCGHTVIRHGFSGIADANVDLSNENSTKAMLDQFKPDCIINLAALANVDACESNPQSAYLLNLAVVDNLCRWIKVHSPTCHLIHLSTDQLYDGLGPHQEDRIVIRNTYAFSKAAAELAVAGVGHTIIRTNFFGKSRCQHRVSFSDWIYKNLCLNLPLSVFDDVLFSPLSMETLSTLIEHLVQQRPTGIFNLGSCEGMSKADFSFAFARALGLPDFNLHRCPSSERVGISAYRPKDMRMDCSRFESSTGLKLPKLSDEIILMRSAYLEAA